MRNHIPLPTGPSTKRDSLAKPSCARPRGWRGAPGTPLLGWEVDTLISPVINNISLIPEYPFRFSFPSAKSFTI